MRPLSLTVLVVAATAASATVILARRWVDGQQVQPPVMQAPMTDILVMARDVQAGMVLQADDLRFAPWPAAAVGARQIVRQDGDDGLARFVGQISRRDLMQGEPLTAAALRQTSAGLLAGRLEPGMRAVSVAISNTSAAAGFITPGDRVDVMLAADLLRTKAKTDQDDTAAPMVRYAAETVLTDIKILAIDQTVVRARDGGAIEGKTATLEVTPKQAELLAAAAMLGNLSLSLRGLQAQAHQGDGSPFTADTEASRALNAMHGAASAPGPKARGAQITINRAGQVTAQNIGR